MEEEKRFPIKTIIGFIIGFIFGLFIISFMPWGPPDEMPPISAPKSPNPALKGLSKERGKNELRIFIVGASLTAGYPYEPEPNASYGTLLEKGLRKLFPKLKINCRPAAKPALDSPRLLQIFEEVVEYNPNVICVTLAPNEFPNRIFYGKRLIPDNIKDYLADRLSRARIIFKVIGRRIKRRGEKEEEDLQKEIIKKIFKASPGKSSITGLPVSKSEQEMLIERLKRNMRRMKALGDIKGVPVVFFIGVHNLGGSWPFAVIDTTHKKEADALVNKWRKTGDTKILEEVNKLLEVAPERADLYFLRGEILGRLGRWKEAKAEFEKARDYDQVPMHLTGDLKKAVENEAKELGVPSYFLNDPLRKREMAGIPDPKMFLDYGHLVDKGHIILAEFIAEKLSKLGYIPKLPEGWEDPFRLAAEEWLLKGVTEYSRKNARANLAWANANFYLLFGNFRDALPRLVEAFQLAYTGDIEHDKPFFEHLIFCAGSLAGSKWVKKFFSKYTKKKTEELYFRLGEAVKKGNLFKSLREIFQI